MSSANPWFVKDVCPPKNSPQTDGKAYATNNLRRFLALVWQLYRGIGESPVQAKNFRSFLGFGAKRLQKTASHGKIDIVVTFSKGGAVASGPTEGSDNLKVLVIYRQSLRP